MICFIREINARTEKYIWTKETISKVARRRDSIRRSISLAACSYASWDISEPIFGSDAFHQNISQGCRDRERENNIIHHIPFSNLPKRVTSDSTCQESRRFIIFYVRRS